MTYKQGEKKRKTRREKHNVKREQILLTKEVNKSRKKIKNVEKCVQSFYLWVIFPQAAHIRIELNFLSIQKVDFLPNSNTGKS